MPSAGRLGRLFVVLALGGCAAEPGTDVSLAKRGDPLGRTLRVGQRVPDTAELAAVGAFRSRVHRQSPAFGDFVRCDGPDLVFKDEEKTGADRMMTERLCQGLLRLGALTKNEWAGVRLRITEAWDEKREHAPTSVHYEGRGADVTTSDVDPAKLGRLARLAVGARLDWVFYEDATHVHVSVGRGP